MGGTGRFLFMAVEYAKQFPLKYFGADGYQKRSSVGR